MVILGIYANKQIRTGANRRYLELMEGLGKRGNTVRVLMSPVLEYQPMYFQRVDIPVRYNSTMALPISIRTYMAVLSMRSKLTSQLSDTECIHIHSDMYLKTALFLKKRLHATVFYAVRCDDITRAKILIKHAGYSWIEKILSFFYIHGKKKWREQAISRQADRITFLNTNDLTHFIERTGCDKHKTCVIPGNIGPPRFTPDWKLKNKSSQVTKIVYVGSISVSKGFFVLIDVMAELRRRGYDTLKLVALGRVDPDDVVFDLVRKNGLSEQVIFPGYVQPFPYLIDCDLFVYPTFYDAWGDVVMESLYAGCPAIASNIGGLPELLQYEELLFPPASKTAIVDMIERMILNPDYYQRVRTLCSSRIEELTFDWIERIEEEMISIMSNAR